MLALGRLEEAVTVLENASQHQIGSYPEGGALWLRVRAKLYETYVACGQVKEAEEIKEQLLKYLKFADPDHVILAQLAKKGVS